MKKHHILLVEANLTGHHEVYLCNIALGALRAGYIVTIALSDADVNNQPVDRLMNFLKDVRFVRVKMPKSCDSFGGNFSDFRREFGYRKFFELAFSSVDKILKVDEILFPYFDYALNAVAIFGGNFLRVPVSGIVMRQTFHFSECGVKAPRKKYDRIRKMLFYKLLNSPSVKNLYTIDVTLFNYTKNILGNNLCKLNMINDPAVVVDKKNRQMVRRNLNIGDDERVVLIYGAIDFRKGVRQVLDSYVNCHPGLNVKLILAGVFDEDVIELLNNPKINNLIKCGKVILINKRVPDEEEYDLIMASDAVWVGYVGHYTMSGVLVKAMISNRIILACQDGLIGWHSSRYNKSSIFDPNDSASVEVALQHIYVCDEFCDNGFLEKYSWEAARKLIFKI